MIAKAGNAEGVATQATLTVIGAFICLWALTTLGLVISFPALALSAVVFFLVALWAPRLAFALLVASLFFQGCLTAIGVPWMSEFSTINAPQANSLAFGMSCGVFGVAVLFFGRTNPQYRTLATIALIPLAIVGLYSLYGLTSTSPTSVGAYVRVYATGWLFFLLGISIVSHISQSRVFWITYLLTIPFVIYGLVELIHPEWIYEIFNIPEYMHVKLDRKGMAVDAAKAVEMYSRNFLNLSGEFSTGLKFTRLSGPNIHVITFGYICALLSTFMFVSKRYFVAFLLAFLMIAAGSKGAILLFILYFAIALIRKTPVGMRFGWITEVAIYGGFVFLFMIYGQTTKDYHYLGLMGGIRGFFSNPVGFGIGVGGNLSDIATRANFVTFQRQGYADYALESGMGVLLYQLGVMALIYLACIWRILVLLWRQAFLVTGVARARTDWARIMLTVIVVNSLFQEEAFSPAVFGFAMLMCGLCLRQDLMGRKTAAPRRPGPARGVRIGRPVPAALAPDVSPGTRGRRPATGA